MHLLHGTASLNSPPVVPGQDGDNEGPVTPSELFICTFSLCASFGTILKMIC